MHRTNGCRRLAAVIGAGCCGSTCHRGTAGVSGRARRRQAAGCSRRVLQRAGERRDLRDAGAHCGTTGAWPHVPQDMPGRAPLPLQPGMGSAMRGAASCFNRRRCSGCAAFDECPVLACCGQLCICFPRLSLTSAAASEHDLPVGNMHSCGQDSRARSRTVPMLQGRTAGAGEKLLSAVQLVNCNDGRERLCTCQGLVRHTRSGLSLHLYAGPDSIEGLRKVCCALHELQLISLQGSHR